MACNCYQDVDAKLSEHDSELLRDMLTDPPRVFVTTVRRLGKRGKPPLVMASFCPFCGRRYADAAD